MPIRSVQATILLTFLCQAGISMARARVAVVNCVPGTAGRRGIDQLYAVLSGRRGWSVLSAPSRHALESPVDDPVVCARRELARASRAQTRFEHHRVLEALSAAEALFASGPPSRELTNVLADLHVEAGVSHSLSGDRDSALESFRLASRLAPGRPALDPGRHKPSVVLLYAEAVARSPGEGSLELAAPSGARLWLDGVELGRSETRPTSVPAGIHYLQALLPGHAPAWRKIRVKAGQQTSVRLELRRLSGAERLAALRRELCAAHEKKKVAALANMAGVEAVVLLRQAGRGTRASVHSASGTVLGSPFTPDRREALREALASLDAVVPAAPREDEAARGRDRRDKSWWRTWWGRTAIVSAVIAAVAGAVVVSWAATREEGPYSISGSCWRDACP